ncbi:MAG TPA: YncE family protein [Rhizomicrobium sp.]|jgi:YVTN family beta-propeller protein
MSNLLFTRRVRGARIIAAAIGIAISLGAFQARAANTITFGSNNNSCGGAVMCSTDGTHGYTNNGTGQAFKLSTISQWFQIDVNGSSQLSGQPAEPDKGSGGFLVLNDTGNAVSSFSLTITDDFNANTSSVHKCSGAQTGNICDNFTAHGGSGSYKFNTKLSGTDWDRCTQGTASGQTCTGGSGGVAADFAPNSVTYTWTGQNGSTIPASAYFVISFSGWNNDGWPPPPPPVQAYITNSTDGTVSVIDTSSNTVIATIPVGASPEGVGVTPDGSTVYVTNQGSNDVSVIATSSNTVTDTINVGVNPIAVAVTPDGSKVYVANAGSNTVSVIDEASNTVIATISVGNTPRGVVVTPNSSTVYVANADSANVSVISTASNSVTAIIPVGGYPVGVAVSPDGSTVYVVNDTSIGVSVIATSSNSVTDVIPAGANIFPVTASVTPDGSKLYVTNDVSDNVTVIDTSSNTVTSAIPVGAGPFGLEVTPDGTEVYVANSGSGSVSVINTSTNAVTDTIAVGNGPLAYGLFIQPVH